MPLTFAHPAAVLPLLRGPLVPAALVAGALAPDVPYFLRGLQVPVSAQSWWEPFMNATTTHDWPGAATISLPTALLLYLAITACVRPFRWLIALTGPTPRRPARVPAWWGWMVLSLIVGVVTHVVWDSFTHSEGWVVQNVAFLNEHAAGSLTWARLLQHLSTAVGLAAIAVYSWRRRGQWFPASRGGRRLTRRAAIVGLAAAILGAVAVVVVRDGLASGVEHVLASAAVGAGLGAATAVVAFSLVWWVTRPDKERPRPS